MNECCESNVILLRSRNEGTDIHRIWQCTKCDEFVVTINGEPAKSILSFNNRASYIGEKDSYFLYIPAHSDAIQYQLDARKTLLPISKLPNLAYLGLGLSDEAGEVSGKIKKIYRDANGNITPETKNALIKELGDVTWYLANICTEIQVPLSEVMDANIEKLFDREERNMIQGDGDDR